MNDCRAPQNEQEFAEYYRFRWQMLRKPWGQARGSEQDELEKQAIHRFIVDDQKQVLAVGRLHFCGEGKAQIRYMAVADNMQGQGLGKQLIDALELVAQQYGVLTVELNAREVAHGFYLRLGYKGDTVSHVLYDQITHYAMVKQLSDLSSEYYQQTTSLVETWYKTIPLSRAMAINISRYDGENLTADCDISFNKNLHNTMFAGSIYTLATLTGWGWVYLKLAQANMKGDIVLADANINYYAPIGGAAFGRTVCTQSTADFTPLLENKVAKLSFTVEVLSGEQVAAKFVGKYAVLPVG